MPTCTLTTTLAALLTPLIAIIAVYVAYRQWRTGQNKLKLISSIGVFRFILPLRE